MLKQGRKVRPGLQEPQLRQEQVGGHEPADRHLPGLHEGVPYRQH